MDSLSSSILSLHLIEQRKAKPVPIYLGKQREYKNDGYTTRQRLFLTNVIFLSFCVEAMHNNLTGPTLLHMSHVLNEEISLMSLTFSCEWCGYLIGCILAGIVYAKLNEELQFALTQFLVGTTALVYPWLPSIYGYFAMKTINSIGIAYHNIISHTHILKMWNGEKLKTVIYPILLLMNPLGAVLAPLIIAPFLCELPQHLDSEDGDNFPNVTSNRPEVVMNYTYKNSGSSTEVECNSVRYSFMIFASFSMILCIIYSITFIYMKNDCTYHRTNSQTSSTCESEKEATKMIFVVCCSMVSFSAATIVIQSWIAPFTIDYLSWSSRQGSYITSAYWCGMCLGRLAAIFLLTCLSPKNFLQFLLLFTLLTVLLTTISSIYCEVLLWIFVPSVGVSVSSTFGALFLWMANHITVTSAITATVISFYSMGYIFTGVITGYLFDHYTSMVIMYISIFGALGQIVFYAFGLSSLKCIYGKNSQMPETKEPLSKETAS